LALRLVLAVVLHPGGDELLIPEPLRLVGHYGSPREKTPRHYLGLLRQKDAPQEGAPLAGQKTGGRLGGTKACP